MSWIILMFKLIRIIGLIKIAFTDTFIVCIIYEPFSGGIFSLYMCLNIIQALITKG